MVGIHNVLSQLAWPVSQCHNDSLIVESYDCCSCTQVSAEQVYSKQYKVVDMQIQLRSCDCDMSWSQHKFH